MNNSNNELIQEKLKRLDYKIEKINKKGMKQYLEKKIDDMNTEIEKKQQELYDQRTVVVVEDHLWGEKFMTMSLSDLYEVLRGLQNQLRKLENKQDNYRKQKQEVEQKQMQQNLNLKETTDELLHILELATMRSHKYALQSELEKNVDKLREIKSNLINMKSGDYGSLSCLMINYQKCIELNQEIKEMEQIIAENRKDLKEWKKNIYSLKKENYVA